MLVTEPNVPPACRQLEAPDAHYPGQKLGVLGLILSCVLGAVGLIVSLVALAISLRARTRNTPALAGVVIGALVTSAFVVGVWYFFGLFLASNAGSASNS